MSSSSELESKIRSGLTDPLYVEVIDVSDGCGSKFEVTIVAAEFEGKALLQQHRLVNKLIEEERGKIHALTLKTIAPSKWSGIPATSSSTTTATASAEGEEKN